jgi:hypothetical protein
VRSRDARGDRIPLLLKGVMYTCQPLPSYHPAILNITTPFTLCSLHHEPQRQLRMWRRCGSWWWNRQRSGRCGGAAAAARPPRPACAAAAAAAGAAGAPCVAAAATATAAGAATAPSGWRSCCTGTAAVATRFFVVLTPNHCLDEYFTSRVVRFNLG